MTDRGGAPAPATPDQRDEDRRALKVVVVWLCCCAAVGALLLVFAIWLDWV